MRLPLWEPVPHTRHILGTASSLPFPSQSNLQARFALAEEEIPVG